MSIEPPNPGASGSPEEPEEREEPEEVEEGGAEVAEEAEEAPEFADLPLPALDALRSALDWAFAGEEVPAGYLDRCAEHALLVQEANRRMNLTKIVEPK